MPGGVSSLLISLPFKLFLAVVEEKDSSLDSLVPKHIRNLMDKQVKINSLLNHQHWRGSKCQEVDMGGSSTYKKPESFSVK